MNNNNRMRAIVVGILFILATTTAIIGLVSYDPILNGSDYLIKGSEHANQIKLGAIMELILVVTAIGTAIALFPLLRRHNESIALAHLCFRFLEAVVITVGIISMLTLFTLSQEYVKAGAPDVSFYEASGTLLRSVYRWAFLFGPGFFLGINTMMYSYLLFKTKLVPRVITSWGLIGATSILINAILVLYGVIAPFTTPYLVLSFPIATYEMILAVWLIVKGFNQPALAALLGKTKAAK